MTDKETYRRLCEAEGSRIPVFQQAWWMDAVCEGKEWDAALARDGERVLAMMPYLLRQRFGMRYVLQPQLTQFSGPYYFVPQDMSPARRVDFEHKVSDLLIDQLESLRLDWYCQRFAPSVTDWLPFHWRGYSQTTRYTYRIDDITDPQRVFDGFDRTKERQRRTRRISEEYTTDNIDTETFVKFHEKYWLSRGEKDILPLGLMRRVIDTACSRGQGLTLGLRDDKGRLVVAWFAVYDDHCAHALLSAKSPETHSADVSALLVWRMIETLSSRTAAFDFEGSMERSLEYFYRSFGARQVPLLEVSRISNPLFNILLKLHR